MPDDDALNASGRGELQLGVQIRSHLGVRFKAINVLEAPEIREGIKTYSDWPTIPQLYVKGEFVGGCDIMKEMYVSGGLQSPLAELGIETDPV